jgi:hypothetical protein
MTRIERIFADPIRANPLNPRHPRAILILHYTGGNSMHRLHLLLCGLCLLLAGLSATAFAQDAPPAVFHDSRDDAFRTPGGAQPFGGQVTLRLRTAADAAADVAVVATNLAGDAVVTLPMRPVATADGADWWEATLALGDAPAVWNYQFHLTLDGAPAFYADDARKDGGPGAIFTAPPPVDQGWNIYVYDPAFTVPEWAANAIDLPDLSRIASATATPPTTPPPANWFYPEECGGHRAPGDAVEHHRARPGAERPGAQPGVGGHLRLHILWRRSARCAGGVGLPCRALGVDDDLLQPDLRLRPPTTNTTGADYTAGR